MKDKLTLSVVLIITLLMSCKSREKNFTAATEGDPLVGTWFTKTSQGLRCQPLESFFANTQMILKAQDGAYAYEMIHNIFLDKDCLHRAIESTAKGTFTLAEAVPSENLPTRGLIHTRHEASVRVVDLDTLHRANLKTAQGLQGGGRLCELPREWKLGEKTSVLGLSCPLAIPNQEWKEAINVMKLSITPPLLVLGQDQPTGEFSRAYVRLIEQNLTSWYKSEP